MKKYFEFSVAYCWLNLDIEKYVEALHTKFIELKTLDQFHVFSRQDNQNIPLIYVGKIGEEKNIEGGMFSVCGFASRDEIIFDISFCQNDVCWLNTHRGTQDQGEKIDWGYGIKRILEYFTEQFFQLLIKVDYFSEKTVFDEKKYSIKQLILYEDV